MPKILGWRRPGKIGHSRHKGYFKYPFKYSSLAQSVERMTVNHDVAGSSPAGGAKQKRVTKRLLSFVFLSFVRLAPARRHDCATCCAERRLLFCKTKNRTAFAVLFVSALPIFPGRLQPSIFGACELNFRVRNGNGWTLTAINTNCHPQTTLIVYHTRFRKSTLFFKKF